MGKPWLHILMISSIALILTLLVVVIFYPVPRPPLSEMKDAREAISLARTNRAETYAPDLFRDALAGYDSAMAEWSRANRVFIYKRSYSKVLNLASLSQQNALKASAISLNSTSNFNVVLEKELKDLNNLLAEINTLFPSYPLTTEVRNKISQGKMLLRESEVAYKGGHYLEAERKLSESKVLLESSFEYANSHLTSYFKSFSKWRNWIDSTLAISRRNGDYTIIIDKFSHKFYLYHNGEKVTEFNAELGKNWVGDKRRRGDKATPEGMYRVTKKLDGDSTTYYKALMIDYPNEEDTLEFNKAVESGSLSPSARIGDMIEIHGDGGRGADWTAGCVALKNREMDSIFKYVEVGTPVTIVGSMYNLRHVLNRQ